MERESAAAEEHRAVEPLEEPAEGARSQERYDHSGTVTPLEEPAEGAPEDANAPPAADTAS